ncbi:MAG: hypothetical protein QXU75_06460 [Candidatus Methanomethylicaceae archaeon]
MKQNDNEIDGQLTLDIINEIKKSDGRKSQQFFTSSITALQANSLARLREIYDSQDVYQHMAKADEFCRTMSVPQKLAEWRAEMWSMGFRIQHPNPDIDMAYRKFANEVRLDLIVSECARHLSVMNNACIIWRIRSNGELEYVQAINPAKTRIDILNDILWCEPSSDFKKAILNTSRADLEKFISKYRAGSSVRKWVEAVINPEKFSASGEYVGKVPLRHEDGEYWMIIPGDGGSDDNRYSPVTMRSIFTDLEMLQMLYEGDWATAWMFKNMIMLVKVGESITSGPLAGSRKNWAKPSDLKNLKAEMEKVGKAQVLYANHTTDIQFKYPDPEVFSPEKYRAVLERICWYFGIGPYLVMGQTPSGVSYATTSWNVQSIRLTAKKKRELLCSHLYRFFTDPTIVKAVFRGIDKIYINDFVLSIEYDRVLKLKRMFKNLTLDNIGAIEYSDDGFATSRRLSIKDAYSSDNSLVLSRNVPEGAKPENFRLVLTPKQALDLYGPPNVKFDIRVLREDRQNLSEISMLLQQGPLSNTTALRELGFDLEEEVEYKDREWKFKENLIPIFERNQGLINIYRGSSAGTQEARGRPRETDIGEVTNDYPRPSTS